MRNDKDNIIVNKTIEFSIAIIKYCGLLEQHRRFVISKQLLRSATSIGANVFEAQNAESKADFIHKKENCSQRNKRNFILAYFMRKK